MLAACGVAAASTFASGATPGDVTITVSLPIATTTSTGTVLNITVPSGTTSTSSKAREAANLKAALADPAKISSVADPKERRLLKAELRDLDAFLAKRPKLQPYREHLWYVAHHTHPALAPQRLAGLLWCTVWFPHDCG